MKTIKMFGGLALLLVAGAFVVPALAQQMQSRAQVGDCVSDCDCDGVPDRDQLQSRTQDCSCDGTQARDRLQDGVMKQDRDRLCQVADQLRTQQRTQLKDQSC